LVGLAIQFGRPGTGFAAGAGFETWVGVETGVVRGRGSGGRKLMIMLLVLLRLARVDPALHQQT
jgi:hypothetical protein